MKPQLFYHRPCSVLLTESFLYCIYNLNFFMKVLYLNEREHENPSCHSSGKIILKFSPFWFILNLKTKNMDLKAHRLPVQNI